jgi:hypothetical protein
MALTGVHIAIGSCNNVGSTGPQPASLPFIVASSQTMATAATSTISVTGSSNVLSISASAPIFYAVGPSPVADGSDTNPRRRYYDPAAGREDIFVQMGDKFAWVFA